MSKRVGNVTGFKSLDKLGNDPRVERIDFEGHAKDGGDGFWLYTMPGTGSGMNRGSHIIHEYTIAEVISRARNMRPCDCSECAKALKERP